MLLVMIKRKHSFVKTHNVHLEPCELNVWIIEVFWFFSFFRSDSKRVLQEFLKSEVSAENILFYQACEKFKKIPPTKLEEVCKILFFFFFFFFTFKMKMFNVNENQI